MDKFNLSPEQKEQIAQNILNSERKKSGLAHSSWFSRHYRGMFAAGGILCLCLVCTLVFPFSYSSENADSAAVSYDAGTGYLAEYEDDYGYDEGYLVSETDSSSSSTSALSFVVADDAKRVYSGYVSIQTQDYSASKSEIMALISKYDGFIQDDSTYSNGYSLPSGCFTVRIPTENFDAFMNSLSTTGNVITSSRSAQNITESYYNTAGQIESLEKERDRLNEMMGQATSVSDLIEIEDKLMQVEQSLQSYQQSLAGMDLDLEYSTISIDLAQVEVYSAADWSLASRITAALSDTWNVFVTGLASLLIALIYAGPWLVLGGLILLVVYLIVRKKQQKQ